MAGGRGALHPVCLTSGRQGDASKRLQPTHTRQTVQATHTVQATGHDRHAYWAGLGGGTCRQTTYSLTTVEETAHKAGNGHGCSVMHISSCRAIRIELWGLHQACNLHAGGEVGREIFTAAGGARLNDPPCEGWRVCHAARACAARRPCVYWACAARVGRWC